MDQMLSSLEESIWATLVQCMMKRACWSFFILLLIFIFLISKTNEPLP
jgi:hypothetical protein